MSTPSSSTEPSASTPDNVRVCMQNPDHGRSYCGRKKHKGLVNRWVNVVCNDCRAAARADGRLR